MSDLVLPDHLRDKMDAGIQDKLTQMQVTQSAALDKLLIAFLAEKKCAISEVTLVRQALRTGVIFYFELKSDVEARMAANEAQQKLDL